MFREQARLHIDIIFVFSHVGRSTTTEIFAHLTRENLQIAFELARKNLSEQNGKQKAADSKLPPIIPEFIPGQKVLVYKPYQSTYDKACLAMARAVHNNMFQIIIGCLSGSTGGRYEASAYIWPT